MNKEQFFYWLKGFAELGGNAPNAKEWQIIKDHITLVSGERKTTEPLYLQHNTNWPAITC